MAKVIIGIHGLGNKPRQELLENWWKKAILEGLDNLGKPYVLPMFELVYWADILYDKPLDEKIQDDKDPYKINEKYTPGDKNFVQQENSLRQKVLDFVENQLDKLFLNDDLTVNYAKISDMVIHHYFKDLELYYTVECSDQNDMRCKARTRIQERLVSVLRKYKQDEIFLIGHSMGSIVAYDVLTFLVPEINIHTFVTMGSPLGFPVVQGKIAAEWNTKRLVAPSLKTPPGVKKHWYNFADLKDKIALIYDLSENFESNRKGVVAEDFVVYNDYQINDEYNPHKSYGYLRTKAFSEVLSKFCNEKISITKRLRSFISKTWSRLF